MLHEAHAHHSLCPPPISLSLPPSLRSVPLGLLELVLCPLGLVALIRPTHGLPDLSLLRLRPHALQERPVHVEGPPGDGLLAQLPQIAVHFPDAVKLGEEVAEGLVSRGKEPHALLKQAQAPLRLPVATGGQMDGKRVLIKGFPRLVSALEQEAFD